MVGRSEPAGGPRLPLQSTRCGTAGRPASCSRTDPPHPSSWGPGGPSWWRRGTVPLNSIFSASPCLHNSQRASMFRAWPCREENSLHCSHCCMHRVPCQSRNHRAHWALRFNERELAVKQWAFPRIDPHTVNDMRINYAQGSRQAELATVDGAEKRRVGVRHHRAAQSVSPGDCFIILFKCGWIYYKARWPAEEEQMIYTPNKYTPLELRELLIKPNYDDVWERENEPKPMDFPRVDGSNTVALSRKTRRPLISKRIV